MMSLKLWVSLFQENTMMLILLLALNCLLWLFAGKYLKLYYFLISGIAGLLVITGFVVSLF